MHYMQRDNRNPGIHARTQTFPRQVLKCYHEMCLKNIREPTFSEMKQVPAAKAFLSHLKSEPILRMAKTTYGDISRDEVASCPSITEMPPSFDELTQQKLILILDQERRTLGAIRWIRGEGDPFFINSFAKAERVESVLAQVPMPTVPDAPAAPKARHSECEIHISEGCRGGEFRIADKQVLLAKVANEFCEVGPDLSYWTLRSRFDALKALSEAQDFIAKFKHTELRYELAGTVRNSLLSDAAVYVMAESNQPIAVMSWALGAGKMFFQNLLNDGQQQVKAILASVEASVSAASR